MADYRVDEVEKPERHPDAVKRLTSRDVRLVLLLCVFAHPPSPERR
jgi:hypothetical protein